MDLGGIEAKIIYDDAGAPTGIVISGTVQDQTEPVNGVQVDAWAVSRFTSTPALGDPIPSDGLPADLGPVTSGAQFGSNGAWQLTAITGKSYYIRALYQNTNYWQLTNEALLLNSGLITSVTAPLELTSGDLSIPNNTYDQYGIASTLVSAETARAENAESALAAEIPTVFDSVSYQSATPDANGLSLDITFISNWGIDNTGTPYWSSTAITTSDAAVLTISDDGLFALTRPT